MTHSRTSVPILMEENLPPDLTQKPRVNFLLQPQIRKYTQCGCRLDITLTSFITPISDRGHYLSDTGVLYRDVDIEAGDGSAKGTSSAPSDDDACFARGTNVMASLIRSALVRPSW